MKIIRRIAVFFNKPAEHKGVSQETLDLVDHWARKRAHDISNPVSLLQGYASMFLKNNQQGFYKKMSKEDLHQEALECFQKIFDVSESAFKKIQELSHLTQAKKFSSPKGVNALELLHKVIGNFKSEHKEQNKTVVLQSPETFPQVYADVDYLEKAISFLLQNAFESSEKDVRIEISLRLNEDSAIIDIKDNGAGIPQSSKPHLGKAFFSTKNGPYATGMGLYLSKVYLESFGGSLQIEPQKTGGVVASVSVPIFSEAGQM